MWAKGKFYRFSLIKKLNIIFFTFFFYLCFINSSQANFQEKLINKYKTIDTLSFDFTQKIGDKVEFGNCYIKYPLLMKCEYPKKKKSIITNGKKFAIVKRRYKKIYYYPLKKTPLFYLLNKENILNVIQNYEPTLINSNIIEYELTDNNLSKVNIFFDKNSLEFLGWKTMDAYSNEVNFLIRNIETNIPIKNEIFKIPREEDL
jgi:outer membrane lipoprotein-sorting protein